MRNLKLIAASVPSYLSGDSRGPKSGAGSDARAFCDRFHAARHFTVYHLCSRVRPWSPSHTVVTRKTGLNPLRGSALLFHSTQRQRRSGATRIWSSIDFTRGELTLLSPESEAMVVISPHFRVTNQSSGATGDEQLDQL